MNNTFLKSTVAVIAGLAAIFILSIMTDIILEKTGAMKMNAFNQSSLWLNILVVFLRMVYDITGAYLAAKLAPNYPIRHAMIIGIIGVAVNTSGAVMTWNNAPHWMALILVALPIPCAWIGASLKKQV